MNDRFKFRGKRLDNNEWYYGSYLYLHNADRFDWNGTRHSNNEDVHFIIDDKDVNYAIDAKTIGQCTGLKDKNGTLIYEGDVVKDDHEALHYVKWCYLGFELNPLFENGYTIGIVDDEIEVIGNIYDNPELLSV